MSERRVKWQCRRGMRELDVLLGTYLEKQYGNSDESQKAAFRRVLELPDPDLIGYLLSGNNPADPELADVIDQIRGKASA
ncbi:MAG: succinate dehydrogenase assembly factor 2 [Proteobacteria bacterium]|nr:succinate dehydrogenase assembly factor 2 [Pseudomonadota bacterium]MDA0993407.1 succinate dehydrogenase assembly factor 2 [Pseudomonadota bacterium]